ncbi:tryptophan halogenase family protein [Sphingomonas crusticola]|uniref:tryptophan halogenase family protein n=1 Tax=Sphingomonas crusticola TaxID=1697973 RepID=UPI000E25048F|nr:tryptophan halogenase family protein [Sphingomonas crusticola]
MEANGRPLRIVIVGGGTAGWMAAAGLARLLLQADYDITLIESDEIGTVGVGEATLPHIKTFNDMLGINEAQFMRDTQATFKLGIEFVGWDRPAERYIHPFGQFGEPWAGVDFQHHWARAVLAGEDVGPLQDYSFAVAAAKVNAFEFPNENLKSIRSTYAYAYHFDAGLYANFLRSWATARGIRRIEGQVTEIGRNAASGFIETLTMKTGAVVTGDVFIDCSGFRSLLLDRTMGVPWQDWSEWLPCDRALAMPCARTEPLLPYTRATACSGGWTWRIPLQHRTGNGYVFSSSFLSEDQAYAALVGALDGTPQAEPRLLRFAAGRRERAWEANVIGIGLAGGFLEPLESTSIFLIQAAVLDLANLMPTRATGIDPRLAAEFNRLFEVHYDRTRDFLVLHYYANRREGEPLWDHLRAMRVPDSLAQKIALFEASAAAPDYKYGLFSRDSWLAVLAGQGMMPRGYNCLADRLPLNELGSKLRDLRRRVRINADAMTGHSDFIANYCAGPGPSAALESAA